MLDLHFTNHPEMFLSVVDNLPGTDHDAFQLKLKWLLYNYKKADFTYFSTLLSHVLWHLIDYSDDIESSWNMWKDQFFAAVHAAIAKTKWNCGRYKK